MNKKSDIILEANIVTSDKYPYIALDLFFLFIVLYSLATVVENFMIRKFIIE